MRKVIFTLVTLLTLSGAYAQTPANVVTTTTPAAPIHTINKNSIVKDSLGNAIPYDTWKQMVVSGDYILRSRQLKNTEADENMVYTLVKASEQQKANRLRSMAARVLTKPAESAFFTTGEVIKPFKVKDINGNKIEAKDWAGKTVVLNFWFIGCPPCRAEIPELNKLADKYASNPNVVFIAISLDEGYEIKDFIKTNPYKYHLISNGTFDAHRFKINLYPTNVVIDKEGKVRYHTVGTPSNNVEWIDKTIAECDSGQPAQHAAQ